MAGSIGKAKAESSYLLPEDSADGNNFVSEFEKAHPLVVPKALSQVTHLGTVCHTWGPGSSSLHIAGKSVSVTFCPCVCPLSQDNTLALLKALGASEGGRSGARRGAGRVGRHATQEARFSDEGSVIGMAEPADPPGSLGAKLQELGRRLLQVRLGQAWAKGCKTEVRTTCLV